MSLGSAAWKDSGAWGQTKASVYCIHDNHVSGNHHGYTYHMHIVQWSQRGIGGLGERFKEFPRARNNDLTSENEL